MDKFRLLGRNWRLLSLKRVSSSQRKQLFTSGGTPKTTYRNAISFPYGTFSNAEQGLSSESQESSSRENGDSVAEMVDSNEVTKPDFLEEMDKDSEIFMPFKSGEDPTMYQSESFQHLFENSQFVKALNPVGKEVEAEVLAVVEDKLYVDFGCKFHAVVTCPDTVRKSVCRGTKLIIVVRDLEVTQAFIGGSKHDSLLEATAEFVRLQV